jgi:hypothetical protein
MSDPKQFFTSFCAVEETKSFFFWATSFATRATLSKSRAGIFASGFSGHQIEFCVLIKQVLPLGSSSRELASDQKWTIGTDWLRALRWAGRALLQSHHGRFSASHERGRGGFAWGNIHIMERGSIHTQRGSIHTERGSIHTQRGSTHTQRGVDSHTEGVDSHTYVLLFLLFSSYYCSIVLLEYKLFSIKIDCVRVPE